MTTRASNLLSREEMRELTQASNFHGFRALLGTWAIIAGAFALVAWDANPLTIALALLLLGGRQLALAVMMHECSHRSLFRTRWLNDALGVWLIGAPVWTHLDQYRVHHMAHHNHTGTDKDTDLGLVEAFPTTRQGMARKLGRDLVGITGVKRIFGLLLMDLGILSYTASTGARRLDQSGRSWVDLVRSGVRRVGPVLLTNLVIWGVLFALGQGWLYLLWVVAYLTVFSFVVRVRSIAEHACTLAEGQSPDILLNTRTTHANWLARLTVAPLNVNYHIEHHLLMTVPYYKLPKLHALLRERGALVESGVARGYLDVLRLASSRELARAPAP